jgi:hypothetical protein
MPVPNLNKRVVFAVLLLTVAAGLYFLYPRLRIILPLKLDYSRVRTPEVYIVPIARQPAPLRLSPAAARPIMGEWFAFSAPWTLLEKSKKDSVEAFRFEKERIYAVSLQKKEDGFLRTLLGSDPEESRQMREYLGAEHFGSNYDAVEFCLNTTPESARFFSDPQELSPLPVLLILKAAFSPLGDVIYRVRIDQAKGFQFGDPATATDVFVYLFDHSDRLFRMKFSFVNQEEIDYILGSIRFTTLPPAMGG